MQVQCILSEPAASASAAALTATAPRLLLLLSCSPLISLAPPSRSFQSYFETSAIFIRARRSGSEAGREGDQRPSLLRLEPDKGDRGRFSLKIVPLCAYTRTRDRAPRGFSSFLFRKFGANARRAKIFGGVKIKRAETTNPPQAVSKCLVYRV